MLGRPCFYLFFYQANFIKNHNPRYQGKGERNNQRKTGSTLANRKKQHQKQQATKHTSGKNKFRDPTTIHKKKHGEIFSLTALHLHERTLTSSTNSTGSFSTLLKI
jgi:hypothetical protein